jgi:membrane-associated protease RseP (regulator of RpoE activity)
MNSTRRFLFLAPLIILASSFVGGMYAPGMSGASAASSEDDIRASLHTFTKLYNLVERNNAEAPDPDKAIYNGAIPGMLRTLDPHSSFFDPKVFQLMREEQRGHYFGVGMHVAPRDNKTVVVDIFAGAPAYKAGIRPGDIIAAVGDKPTEGLTTSDVAELLKGPRGTVVKVTVVRQGHEAPLVFDVTRDEIFRNSVPLWLLHPARHRLYTDPSIHRNHQPRTGRAFEAPGRAEHQGYDPRLARQPGRAAQRGRGRGRPVPSKRTDHRLSPRAGFRGEVLRSQKRQ